MIQELAHHRLLLRRLGWRTTFDDLTRKERQALNDLIPLATKGHEAILRDAKWQLKVLKSARGFRSLVKDMDLGAVVSLHLSSHGDGLGAFNKGFLYPLRRTINRVAAYSTLDEVLRHGASVVEGSLGDNSLFRDTLRPSRLRSWDSYFLDRPFLGGEVSALAGYLGVSLVTLDDARQMWGTPYDLPENVNWEYALQQSGLAAGLVNELAQAPSLHAGNLPREGFATVTGRANFIRHGELFADQPAPGSIILAYQSSARFYAMVDTMGTFQIKGVADKRHVLDKVIIEGYRFEPDTGSVVWAIDKKQTGKAAYRLKMQRRNMETELVMFSCKETTLFNLLEPRTFRYMTKIQLIDGRREVSPLRYWWSRIDTRSSIISSIYLEPGTPVKITNSDTVLRKKMILTNATDTHPEGVGYRVDDWPFIHNTEYRVARDMWALLAPRIANLEDHGIYNERIRKLQREGTAALQQAEQALQAKLYDQFAEASRRSWALASRVYDHVEETQKDVLFGVLFYIALFVPFAFCMERLVFSYSDIHKRIIAFSIILVLLIALIYEVHPAFHLTYSPMVVILAFFIIGLSLMVTLIIFSRFEQEMILLQSRARHVKSSEISRWKAFVAAFFLGVSNLRRRRLRTILTCATLIILTFTIMSFTSVKTTRHHARILYRSNAPYQGFLLKEINWEDLPPEALGILSNAFGEKGVVVPRVWFESEDRTRATQIPVRFKGRAYEVQGLVGLSTKEVRVSGIDRILVGGRWFKENERYPVLLP
ncbi:MAG: peptide ABC transporter permease, partial [Thermodesulfobacteriota bacterium]